MTRLLKGAVRPLLVGLVAVVLLLSQVGPAWAARSGGRIGGSSFRSPSRSVPSRTYAPSQPGYRGYGGGFGFPLIFPFFIGGGGGGLFSLLLILAVGGFLLRAFQQAAGGGEGYGGESENPPVAVARLQVGLLSSARGLQADLDKLARSANPDTAAGRVQIVQETTLALLRHPEYWAYANTQAQQLRLSQAESAFNQLALSERSKLQTETLVNVNGQFRESTLAAPTDDLAQAPSEYILVTLVVAATGKLALPPVRSMTDVQQTLQQLGSLGTDRLLAVEVIWTPQATGDSLTAEELLAQYPDLKLV
ncbi:MAG: DUF1517 domain-containing protein [Gloeomargaritaceae cyanobacterium C42_A2020_066]|nr:DUF1517 domain-containing protein [Gloeomargaritaceae cyanobacterium C42_A2020_066]